MRAAPGNGGRIGARVPFITMRNDASKAMTRTAGRDETLLR